MCMSYISGTGIPTRRLGGAVAHSRAQVGHGKHFRHGVRKILLACRAAASRRSAKHAAVYQHRLFRQVALKYAAYHLARRQVGRAVEPEGGRRERKCGVGAVHAERKNVRIAEIQKVAGVVQPSVVAHARNNVADERFDGYDLLVLVYIPRQHEL